MEWISVVCLSFRNTCLHPIFIFVQLYSLVNYLDFIPIVPIKIILLCPIVHACLCRTTITNLFKNKMLCEKVILKIWVSKLYLHNWIFLSKNGLAYKCCLSCNESGAFKTILKSISKKLKENFQIQ